MSGYVLELRRKPMSREHALPQSPAASSAGTEEGQGIQPRCRSGPPATEPSGPGGAKLPPPDHTQHPVQPRTQLPMTYDL
jgi:hypothetical protein